MWRLESLIHKSQRTSSSRTVWATQEDYVLPKQNKPTETIFAIIAFTADEDIGAVAFSYTLASDTI